MARNNLSKNNRFIKNAISLIVFIALGWYLYDNKQLFLELKALDIKDILILMAFQVITLFILGLFNMVILKRMEPKITFSESILLQYANNLLNNILPKGGSVYRAIFLKQKYNFSYRYFITSLSGLYVINLIVNSVFALISFLQIYLTKGVYNELVIVIFFTILLVSLILLFLKPSFTNTNNRLIQKIIPVLQGWAKITESPRDIIWLLILASANLFMKSFQMQYLFRSLGNTTGYFEMVYLSTLAVIIQILNITPGGIGVREGLFALSDKIVLIHSDILVFGSLIQRVILLVTSFIFGGLSYIILSRQFKNSEEINISKLRSHDQE